MLHYEYYFAGFCCHCLLVIIVRLSFHYYNTQRVLSFFLFYSSRQPPHLFSHFHPPLRTLCLSETHEAQHKGVLLPHHPLATPTRRRMNCFFYLLAISSPEQTKKVEGLLLFLLWGCMVTGVEEDWMTAEESEYIMCPGYIYIYILISSNYTIRQWPITSKRSRSCGAYENGI